MSDTGMPLYYTIIIHIQSKRKVIGRPFQYVLRMYLGNKEDIPGMYFSEIMFVSQIFLPVHPEDAPRHKGDILGMYFS